MRDLYRAAAAEMRNRISARLADWAVASGATLRDELAGMGITVPSQEMLGRARSLFAEILDNDDGPRVETVLFCQSFCADFPSRPGPPQAELADDFEQQRLKTRARHNVLTHGDPDLAWQVALIAEQTSEGNAETILKELLGKEERIGDGQILQHLERHFVDQRGIDPDLDPEAMAGETVAVLDIEGFALSRQCSRQVV